MVISEMIVLSDTKFTDKAVSQPNLSENIVVIAAVGAQQEITIDTNKSPLIPQRYIIARAIIGNKTSLTAIARNPALPLKILLLVK